MRPNSYSVKPTTIYVFSNHKICNIVFFKSNILLKFNFKRRMDALNVTKSEYIGHTECL